MPSCNFVENCEIIFGQTGKTSTLLFKMFFVFFFDLLAHIVAYDDLRSPSQSLPTLDRQYSKILLLGEKGKIDMF